MAPKKAKKSKKPVGRTQTFFRERRPPSFNAVVAIFDLEGFTQFCAKAQVEPALPKFLNRAFQFVSEQLNPAGDAKVLFEVDGVPPVHYKFLGDGALIIWKLPGTYAGRARFYFTIMARLQLARTAFPETAQGLANELGLTDVPSAIRFGLTFGDVSELQPPAGEKEYVGFPINLASRLQSYCRELGFVASARIGDIDPNDLERKSLVQVKAMQLRGLDNEMVLVDANDYGSLAPDKKQPLFENTD